MRHMVLTLIEFTTSYIGNHQIIIMIKAVNEKYRVPRIGETKLILKIREVFLGEANSELNLEQ